MRFIFLIVRIFPFIAIPLAMLMGQIGLFYRRKKNRRQWILWAISGGLILFSFLWFFFRGDLYSDQWVRFFFFAEFIKNKKQVQN